MLYRRALDHYSLIYRNIYSRCLRPVKKDNYNTDGLVRPKPEVQYGIVLA